MFYSLVSLFRLLFRNMQRRYRGTYLSSNRMAQTETGKQHGDNCRRCKHVTADQSSPVKKQLSDVWEAARSARSEKSKWLNDRRGRAAAASHWALLGSLLRSQSDLEISRKKKNLTTIFSLSWTWCSPLHDVCGDGEENHLCCETTLHPSISPHTGGGNSSKFLVRNVSNCLYSQADCRL